MPDQRYMKKKPSKKVHKPAKKPARLPRARTYALVLSGGAALGAYQAGAIRAFFEAGLDVRCVAGSSIGALNGYLTATRNVDTMVKFWQEIDQKRLITIQSFTKLFFSASPSLLTDQLQRKLVEEHVRLADLVNAPCEYICAAISLNTGKLHYFSGSDAKNDTELRQFILASAAVPGVFPPVQIGHELYMDGGLIRNTPIEAVESKKVDAVIAISMEPETYPKDPLVNTAQIALRTLSIFFRSQADDAIQRATNSRRHKAKKLFLLRPKMPLEMQQYEFDQKKIVRLLDQGYHEAQLFIRHNRLR
jgi:NTE family protein